MPSSGRSVEGPPLNPVGDTMPSLRRAHQGGGEGLPSLSARRGPDVIVGVAALLLERCVTQRGRSTTAGSRENP